MTLEEFFHENPKCALAFSGGTDSCYLLYAAIQCGCDVKAYYVNSPFQPAFELADANRLVAELGASLEVIEVDTLQEPKVQVNPENRCYYCKQLIFQNILERAKKDGYSVILDGTNASDQVSDRPGMKALEEMKVLSPLRLCGITKPQVRRRSKEANLFSWEKPSYACLATRIPAGQALFACDLERVEASEQALQKWGLRDFRVRMYRYGAEVAALEVEKSQWKMAKEGINEIRELLKTWFQDVVLEDNCRKAEKLEDL